MFRQQAFTPAWNKRQWIRWAIERYPNESVVKFKQMRKLQLIAIYHNS